ncbi:hypothetical protein ACIODT_37910 [Streptomyces sp. NPDC088251]|uniref:hypothetical protein n=1 Tax=unclassified Streptomyces TaxID=2593676 RepID=UPI0038001BBB
MEFRGDREDLATGVRAVLERGCPGSKATLLGSLAAGSADVYSDIDVEWIVPDDRFAACLAQVGALLHLVHPVAEVRVDPDFLHSDRRRLLFVRFEQVPLFWRLDLSVRAQSVADEADYDEGNPAARAREGEWSRPASALANAIGAVKAAARHRTGDAYGLVDRGFVRIGEADSAIGAWAEDIKRLARAAVRREAQLATLAQRVAALADERLGHDPERSGWPVNGVLRLRRPPSALDGRAVEVFLTGH